MIDIKLIRENPQHFKKAAANKHFDVDIERLLEIDSALKETKRNLQEIATQKNRLGKDIPKLSGNEKQKALDSLAELKQQEEQFNENIKNFQPEFDRLMLLVPQPPDGDVVVPDLGRW